MHLKAANRLQEVVVNADRPFEENTQMSRIEIPVSQIKAMEYGSPRQKIALKLISNAFSFR